jgi:hypothetical protein
VDGSGNLYVADENNNRVLEYTDPLTEFGVIENTPAGVGVALGVAVAVAV